MATLRIGIIGDYDPAFALHRKTEDALRHCEPEVDITWLASDQPHNLEGFSGLICSPGSPYRSMAGVIEKIAWARQRAVPFLGTCGGFQHALLEFARNVMGLRDAQHAEYDPYASMLFVNGLSCSLAGKSFEVRLAPGSLAAECYGTLSAHEDYYCNFGLNPAYQQPLAAAGMSISGTDETGEARIIELPGHPFFLATLFVPQAKSYHPILAAFVKQAAKTQADLRRSPR